MEPTVQIIEKQEVFRRFVFRIEQVRLRHRRYDGTMSEEIIRLNLDRGDSVATLVHEIDRDCVIFTEQFRYPAYEKGPGWILEIPAGIVEPNEDPQESARREVLEEIGYSTGSLQPITTVYVSPGGSSERIHIFYVPVTQTDKLSNGGGVASEGEDIRIVRIPTIEAFKMVVDGEIVDAKTVLAMQWLRLERRPKENAPC
jgi:nudix-type nucleoside diphosphatase (YffH/AdpP family)